MKMARVVVFLLVVAVLVAGLFGCSQSAPEATKPIELVLSSYQPQTHLQSPVLEQYMKKIEQETNGAVKFTPYYSATLLSSTNDYDGVLASTADMSLSCPSYYGARLSKSLVMQAPGSGIANAVGASRSAWHIYQDIWADQMSDVKVLGVWTGPPNLLIMKSKKVTKAEDLKGLQIRIGGGTEPLIEALGAVPVFIPFNEAYLAIQKGVADGLTGNYAHLKSYKLAEVCKYCIAKSLFISGFYLIMNQGKWNSLPKNVKDVFEKNIPWFLDSMGAAWDKDDKDSLDWAKANFGTEVITLSPEAEAQFDAAMASAGGVWVKDMVGKGFKDAQQMLDKRNAIFKQYGSGK